MKTFKALNPDYLFEAITEIAGQRERFGDEGIDWDAPPLDQLADLPLDVYVEILNAAVAVSVALHTFRKETERRAAQVLGDGGVARFGDTFIRYGTPSPRRKIRDEFFDFVITHNTPDDEALFDDQAFDIAQKWVADVVADIRRAVSLGAPKVTGLDAIGKRLGLEDPKTLRSTFVDEDPKPPEISHMPVDNKYAPKYAARMRDGEIRPGRSKEEE